MRWGVHIGNFGAAGAPERMLGLAAAAERLGFDSVWVSDHVAAPAAFDSSNGLRGSTYEPQTGAGFFEALTTLAVVAGTTHRVRVGTSVLVLPLRNPLLLARELATLDALSGGRVELGVGAGWLAEEFAAMGADFAVRGEVLDEYLEILDLAWTRERGSFDGRHYRFGELLFGPAPVQPGGPPVTVGGHGSRSLRRAARHGGWQAIRERPAGLAEPIAVLRREIDALGRDWDRFRVLVRCRLGGETAGERYEIAGSVDEILETVGEYAELGVTEIAVNAPPDVAAEEAVERIERLAEIVGARVA